LVKEMTLRKVLLVDDEPLIRRVGEVSLSNVGKLETLVAASGSEAIELLTRERPDLILLDVMMPGMDGPTTLARIRSLPGPEAATPVIFLTAKVQREAVEALLVLGAIGVISKPFDPMTLADEVQRLAREGAAGRG
jgi:two-component system, OmpR family, response regulator